jgi:hypothetical protein
VDERTRRTQRQAGQDGSVSARLRLAHEQRRAGRWDEVLAATASLDQEAEAQALRASAWLHKSDLARAIDAAQAATALDPTSVAPEVGAALVERVLGDTSGVGVPRLVALRRAAGLGPGAADALAHAAREPSAFARLQAARLPALAAGLLDDPSPLVRLVARSAAAGDLALRTRCARPPKEAKDKSDEPRTRLFSAHGPDYESGPFLVVDATTEARLSALDAGFWLELDATLGVSGRKVGFSSYGYGLALSPDESRGEGRSTLERRVLALDEAGVLPFPLRVESFSNFDPVETLPVDDPTHLADVDARLVYCYAKDLETHPSRDNPPPVGAGVYARVCAAFGKGLVPGPDVVASLLEEARRAYTPVGIKAIEAFMAGGRRRRTARSNDSAERALRGELPERR